MKFMSKSNKKDLLLLYLTTSLILLLIASNIYTGVVHVASASPPELSSASSSESWVNITITPTPVSGNPDDTFTIEINIDNVTNLKAWDLTLKWELGDLLECIDVEEGPFLKNGTTTLFTKNIDNANDEFDAGALILSGTPRNGSGILANATFQVTNTGNCTLDLYNTELADPNLNPINHTAIGGYFYTTLPKVAPIYDAPSGPYFSKYYIPNELHPGHPIAGETLTFNGSGCYDPDQPFKGQTGTGIVSYKWDFGDGNITTVADPITTHVYPSPDTYNLNLTITDDDGETYWMTAVTQIEVKLHDIAIINVTVSSTEIKTGESVAINATVLNEGSTSEAFNVTAYYIGFYVGEMNTTTVRAPALGIGQNTTATLQWNTTGIALGTYALFVKIYPVYVNNISISFADLEEDLADNVMFGDNITITGAAVHDVAITQVTVEPTELEIGDYSRIRVTVKNEGNTPETNVNVNVTARNAGGIVFQEQQQLDLTAGSSQTLSFTWFTGNETAQEGNYNITAVVPPISGETDLGDNTYPVVTVTMRMLPIARFTYSPSEPFLGGIITFNASTSYAPGTPAPGEPAGTIDKYVWNFGDGNVTTVYNNSSITHIYDVSGEYSVTVTATDNDLLSSSYGRDLTVLVHDVVITNVTFSSSSIIPGEIVSINATVENVGDFNETFIPVRAYFSTTVIDVQTLSFLEPGANETLQFIWNTTGVAEGSYFIRAMASTVDGEADTENNSRIGGVITIEKVIIKISVQPTTIAVGETATINGSIETTQSPLAEVDVTIWYMSSDASWDILETARTDANGRYSHEWTPSTAASYAVKASWPDDTHFVESDVQVLEVEETPAPSIFLYTTAGLGVVIFLLVAVMIYLLRIRKAK